MKSDPQINSMLEERAKRKKAASISVFRFKINDWFRINTIFYEFHVCVYLVKRSIELNSEMKQCWTIQNMNEKLLLKRVNCMISFNQGKHKIEWKSEFARNFREGLLLWEGRNLRNFYQLNTNLCEIKENNHNYSNNTNQSTNHLSL